jgi:hypothetical protein
MSKVEGGRVIEGKPGGVHLRTTTASSSGDGDLRPCPDLPENCPEQFNIETRSSGEPATVPPKKLIAIAHNLPTHLIIYQL